MSMDNNFQYLKKLMLKRYHQCTSMLRFSHISKENILEYLKKLIFEKIISLCRCVRQDLSLIFLTH